MAKRIHVVVNPASGQDRAPLETMSNVFREAGIEWHVSVTKKAGDARRLAHAAAEGGADVVAAYGGDGTVSDVASGLLGTGKRLAIFPGGTANVLSTALEIPDDLAEACALACGKRCATAALDVIEISGNGHVILQAGVGLHAAMVKHARRKHKKRLGWLAYALGALDWLKQPRTHRFQLTLDGEKCESEGVACLICNSGTVGHGALCLSPSISMRDGLLDVLVLRKANLARILALVRSVAADAELACSTFQHWQAREVRVTTDPPQPVQGDGNIIGETPLSARTVPGGLPVIVPENARIVQGIPPPEC